MAGAAAKRCERLPTGPVLGVTRAPPEKPAPNRKAATGKVRGKSSAAKQVQPEDAKPNNPPRLIDSLKPKVQRFVREYLIDLNGTQAAIRAGYSQKTATQIANNLLTKVDVAAAVKEESELISKKLEISAEAIVKRWQNQVEANPNELSQLRRICCRHCWGRDHGYQYLFGEFKPAKLRHEEKRANILAKSKEARDIGDFDGVEGDWYDTGLDPNMECPHCRGKGVVEVFLADTRKLSQEALTLYAGVEEGKDGIKIKVHSQEKANEFLGRHLGVFNDSMKVQITDMSAETLEEKFVSKMRAARERTAAMLKERGLSDGPKGGEE
jgi:phage terminase small subunit